MIHLNPIEYPKFNSREIKILGVDTYVHPSGQTYKRLKVDLTGNQLRTYYGKKLLIYVDGTNPSTTTVGNKCFYARYTIKQTDAGINHYLLIESSVTYNFVVNSVIKVFETFSVVDENQTITFQDLQEKFESNKAKADVDIFGINDIGSNNLVDGYQTEKINQALFDFKTKERFDCTISQQVTDPQFTFKLVNNELNRFKIFLHDSNVDSKFLINIELCIDGFGKYCWVKNNSHFEQESGFDNEKNQYNNENKTVSNFYLKLFKFTDGLGDDYLQILFQSPNTSKTINLTGYVSCKHPQDLWRETNSIIQNETLVLNGTTDLIKIDQTLLFVDTYGEQRTIDYGETLIKSIPLTKNIVNKPVGFYYIDKTDGCPEDVPGGLKDVSRYSENNVNIDRVYFSKLEWSYANLTVYHNDHYLLVTDNFHLFIGKRNGHENIEWRLMTVEGHTHNTDNLIEGAINKFVKQEWINEWNDTTNKVKNTSWKTYDDKISLATLNSVLTKSGDAFVVVNDATFGTNNPQIYIKNGTQGDARPTSIGALMVEGKYVDKPWEDGSLISDNTLTQLKGLGIGIRIPNTDKYISIANTVRQYRLDATTENNVYYDLVKHTGTLSPGNESINFGIGNDVAKQSSILYGVGLANFGTKQTIFGCYNETVTNADIIFGIGTASERKNAFWYGNETFIINGKLYLKNYPADYILVNNGEAIPNNFVNRDEFDKLKKIVEDLDSGYIITGYKELNSKLEYQNYVRTKDINDFELNIIVYGITDMTTDEYGNNVYSLKPGIDVCYIDFRDTSKDVTIDSPETEINAAEDRLSQMDDSERRQYFTGEEDDDENAPRIPVFNYPISYLSRMRIVSIDANGNITGTIKEFKTWEHFDKTNPETTFRIYV